MKPSKAEQEITVQECDATEVQQIFCRLVIKNKP